MLLLWRWRRLLPWLCPLQHWQHPLRCIRQQHQEGRARQSRSCHGEQRHRCRLAPKCLACFDSVVASVSSTRRCPQRRQRQAPLMLHSQRTDSDGRRQCQVQEHVTAPTINPVLLTVTMSASAVDSHLPVAPCCVFFALLRSILSLQ